MKQFHDFKLAFDFASDHIIIMDPKGVIVYANKAAERITGYSVKEMLGERPSLWGAKMSPDYYRAFWKRITGGKIFSGEITNKRKNGEIYEVELHVTSVKDSRGKIKFFVGIERDISEEKKMNRAKTEFVSLVSHQLQSPLVIMKWYLELLFSRETGRFNQTQKKYIREIQSATVRMKSLVDILLDVSRIEMGMVFQDVSLIDPKKIIKEAIRTKNPEARKKAVHVNFRASGAPGKIKLDPRLLNVICDNVLENAIQFSHRNGRVDVELKEISDGKKRGKKSLLLKVRDNGIGIPPSQQPKIFDKFFRADNAESAAPHGNGFGLYIVGAYVKKMRGAVWFESQLGKGSTFWVRLPLKN